jgi:hypothetical protein
LVTRVPRCFFGDALPPNAATTTAANSEPFTSDVFYRLSPPQAADDAATSRITANGLAAEVAAQNVAVVGNPLLYPPIHGTAEKVFQAEAVAAELKVAADTAVAERKWEADQKKAERERVKELHDAVKRGEMAAPSPQQLAAEKATAAAIANEAAIREPARKEAEAAYKNAASVAKAAQVRSNLVGLLASVMARNHVSCLLTGCGLTSSDPI